MAINPARSWLCEVCETLEPDDSPYCQECTVPGPKPGENADLMDEFEPVFDH